MHALYSVKLWLLKCIHTYMLYIGNTERGWMPMKRVWWPTWSSSNSVSRALDDSTNIAAVSKVHNNNNVFHIWLGLAKLISCIRKHTSNDSPNSFLLLQLTTTLYYFWQSKKQQNQREDRMIYFTYLATFLNPLAPNSKIYCK